MEWSGGCDLGIDDVCDCIEHLSIKRVLVAGNHCRTHEHKQVAVAQRQIGVSGLQAGLQLIRTPSADIRIRQQVFVVVRL